MMVLAKTCIIAGTMDGYSHLSIEKREDIMVCWKGHEGISQIRGSSGETSRPYPTRSGATDGRGLPEGPAAHRTRKGVQT
jgi:IS30 family transposase